MKILYLSYDGMSDPLGQSQVLPYLAGLTKEGHEFHLISFEKPEKLAPLKSHLQTICDDAGIFWYPCSYTKKPPILSTIKDLRVMKKTARRIISEKKIQLIHARGHDITSMVALQMKQEFNVKYLFDMRGFWADERVDGQLWNISKFPYNIIFRFFKKKETLFLQQADHIITLTTAAEKIIRQWQHENQWKPVPISVIPCCADLEIFDFHRYNQQDRKQTRQRLGIPDDSMALCYLGSIGTWYMLKEMLLFYREFSKTQDVYFLFITTEDQSHILSECEELKIDTSKIKITNSRRTEVPVYLNAADFALFFIKPTFSKQGSSPVKHGECLGMGLPVISNKNVGDMELITQNTQSGICISPDEEVSEALVQRILDLKDTDKQLIRQAAFQYYDLNDGIQKYAAIYKKMSV